MTPRQRPPVRVRVTGPFLFFFFQSSRVCFSSFTLSVTYVAQPQSCSTWVTYMELINGTWCVSLASMGRGLGEQPCRTKRLTACPRAHGPASGAGAVGCGAAPSCTHAFRDPLSITWNLAANYTPISTISGTLTTPSTGRSAVHSLAIQRVSAAPLGRGRLTTATACVLSPSLDAALQHAQLCRVGDRCSERHQQQHCAKLGPRTWADPTQCTRLRGVHGRVHRGLAEGGRGRGGGGGGGGGCVAPLGILTTRALAAVGPRCGCVRACVGRRGLVNAGWHSCTAVVPLSPVLHRRQPIGVDGQLLRRVVHRHDVRPVQPIGVGGFDVPDLPPERRLRRLQRLPVQPGLHGQRRRLHAVPAGVRPVL